MGTNINYRLELCLLRTEIRFVLKKTIKAKNSLLEHEFLAFNTYLLCCSKQI